ncbi:MAG: arginine decarboxylase [Balneolaceae bacterium]|nr:arginine decarboxylase [Balneolaceae bacterium]MBO6546456.1 arginine decarboxylase [Balneolaceae bacterium]MBO6648815.1 arginine decarboxylase [Balneolaceae bacterium]
MRNTYKELIEQTYYFPQNGFELHKGYLSFNGVDLKSLINKYGTPFRLTYLPKIREQIQEARSYFTNAIKEFNYKGKYEFCYCTKCCHFSHVIRTALKEDVSLETSSSFDIDLIDRLHENGRIDKDKILVHNGYKTDNYIQKIGKLLKTGFRNSITILDNPKELEKLEALDVGEPIKIGLRISIEEDPGAAYYTSRLGINKREILELVKKRVVDNPKFDLVMVHFFVDSGINDTLYYWGEFQKALSLYTQIKKLVPSLNALNIGGGFPIQNTLSFNYDYQYIVNEIVRNVKETCNDSGIEEPDLYTEFGKFTVGESGAVIFEVLEQKQQNDTELWYIINNSLMNTIPDAWSINEKFILLPLNKWENGYKRVNIGGISCDHSDYYNSEQLNQQILLPGYSDSGEEPLYIGFFHTGAYQDAISGYGGIKHCLIPSPKQVVVDLDDEGNLIDHVYREEQNVENMLTILGYND